MKAWHFLRSAAVAAVIAAGLGASAPVFAQVYNYGSYAINGHDREALREFIVDEHARACNNNETRPIEPCGVASRVLVSYVAGSFLPLDVHDEVIPRHIAREIAPAPQGAAYVYANDTVYLIDVLSRKIIDTVQMATD